MTETTYYPALPGGPLGLTREYLQSGGLGEFIRRANPDVRLLTDTERAESLAAVLADRPDGGEGVWVFAYGSLIWNPAMHIVERQLARADGWHRAFCLATKGGRGTADNPGMLLGLQQGGDCIGAVLRVAEDAMAQEFDILWRREMVADGYIPRWVSFETIGDSTTPPISGHAIAFTINPVGSSFCGPLPEDELVRRIATARGELGTASDYLFNTRDGLRALGITDSLLERLGEQIARLQAALNAK